MSKLFVSTHLDQLTERTLAIFEHLVWWNAFLVLDLGLDDVDGLDIKGDGFACAQTSTAADLVECLLVPDLGLDIVDAVESRHPSRSDGVAGLDIQGHGLAREGFHEDKPPLHRNKGFREHGDP